MRTRATQHAWTALFLLASVAAPARSILPSWCIEADQPNARLGHAVCTAGDVNRDGYSDVIVGVFRYDGGASDEGRVLIFLGSATGPGAEPAWGATGGQAGAYFGFSVAAAGDVNGDGYGDVVVGAVGYDGTHSGGGRAFLYLGGEDGPSASPDWTADGDQMGAALGASVAGAVGRQRRWL